MASRAGMWRSISWSKKNKTKNPNKDLPKLDTSLANTKIHSTADPLTPPSYSQAFSPRTVVDTNRRVGNGSPITPPESPNGGIFVDREFGFGYGDGDKEGSGEGEGEGSSGSSQENEKPFQRSVDRDIKRMVEGPDRPSPVSGEWTEEVSSVLGQDDEEIGEIEEEREVQAQVVSRDVQGKSGEKKEKRMWRRNFWRGIGIGKGKDKCGVVGKADDGSPSDVVQFNAVNWGPKEMGNDEGQDKNDGEKEKEEKGEKQRSKSDGQAKRPKNIGRGKEEISVKRRWTIPSFRKNTLEVMGAEGIESESEQLERERKQERQERSIEHKKKYPDSVLDDIKDEHNDCKEIASSQLDEFVQAGKNLEAEAKAKAKAKARALSRVS